MSAYFILTQTITDTERYQKEYIPGVLPFLAKYKAEVVVADFNATPLQGEPAKGWWSSNSLPSRQSRTLWMTRSTSRSKISVWRLRPMPAP